MSDTDDVAVSIANNELPALVKMLKPLHPIFRKRLIDAAMMLLEEPEKQSHTSTGGQK